jgi:hypothetical protein
MSDEEKPMDLRDKMAMEILNGLLAGDPNRSNHEGASTFITHHFGKDMGEESKRWARNKAEQLIRTAYMMADIARKVRIGAFE